MFRTYSLRLKPTQRQRQALETILTISCDLYNAALQERRDAWNIARKRVTYYDQGKQLTEIRAVDPDVRAIAFEVARDALNRVDKAFKAFFRRCQAKQTPGFPRFRAPSRYNSFTFGRPVIKEGKLSIPNLGRFRFKSHQAIQGQLRSVTVKRNGETWTAYAAYDTGPAPEKVTVSTAIGIDLGLTRFLTDSDGAIVENPRWARRHAGRVAAASRSLALKERGSNNRKRALLTLQRAHKRAVNARRNFTHHISKWLISSHDLVAYENLNIKGMVQSGLAKSILDAAWGQLIWQLTYKAENAGTWAVSVDPKGTTVNCSSCSNPVPKSRSERTHHCLKCGLVLDRDHNAAINILNRARKEPCGAKPLQNVLYA